MLSNNRRSDMKKISFSLGAVALISLTSAQAGWIPSVPEFSAGAGVGAIALLAGVVAILRERSTKR